MFKLFNTKTGLWSLGGYCIKENKTGKVWGSLKNFHGHLGLHVDKDYYSKERIVDYPDIDDYEVVEYEMVVKKRTPLRQYYKKMNPEYKFEDENTDG